GAGTARAGLGAIVWPGLGKTLAAVVMSPLVGFLIALALALAVSWAFMHQTPYTVDRIFRVGQFVSASLYSLGHGSNDAQKTMGIIAALLYSQGHLGAKFHVPFWVVLTCQAAMALGTLAGGWRIVRTMGSRITRLTPVQGFCAETGGAITLFMATHLGIPVSTTHTITGAIVGVGAARRPSAVHWNVASTIVVAWIITIPAAGAIGALTYWASDLLCLAPEHASLGVAGKPRPFAASHKETFHVQKPSRQLFRGFPPRPGHHACDAAHRYGWRRFALHGAVWLALCGAVVRPF